MKLDPGTDFNFHRRSGRFEISTFRVVDAADGSEKGGLLRDVHIGGYVWRRRRTRKDHEW